MTLSSTTLHDIPLTRLDGTPERLGDYADKVLLVVNVASRCGLAPQYEKLEELQRTYASHGFSVLGFPSNQFAQELKTSDAIEEYCSTTWGVTFPMFEKTKVNGRSKHPLYSLLHEVKDDAGRSGRVRWNFEKFLILPNGEMHRFRSTTAPDDPQIVDLIEGALPED
jgi:glutathione peroxidase